MSKKTSVVWNYVKGGVCQIENDGKICGESVGSKTSPSNSSAIPTNHDSLFVEFKKFFEASRLGQTKTAVFWQANSNVRFRLSMR